MKNKSFILFTIGVTLTISLVVSCFCNMIRTNDGSKLEQYNVRIDNCSTNTKEENETYSQNTKRIVPVILDKIETFFVEIQYLVKQKDQNYYKNKANRLIEEYKMVWGIDYDSLADKLSIIDDPDLGVEVLLKISLGKAISEKQSYPGVIPPLEKMINKLIQGNFNLMNDIKEKLKKSSENTNDNKLKKVTKQLVNTIEYYFSIL